MSDCDDRTMGSEDLTRKALVEIAQALRHLHASHGISLTLSAETSSVLEQANRELDRCTALEVWPPWGSISHKPPRWQPEPRCNVDRHEGIFYSVEETEKCEPGLVYVAKCGDLYKIGSTDIQPDSQPVKSRIRRRIYDLRGRTGLVFNFCFGLLVNCRYGGEFYLHSLFRNEQCSTAYAVEKRSLLDGHRRLNKRVNLAELFWLSDEQVSLLKGFSFFNGGEVKYVADRDATLTGRELLSVFVPRIPIEVR